MHRNWYRFSALAFIFLLAGFAAALADPQQTTPSILSESFDTLSLFGAKSPVGWRDISFRMGLALTRYKVVQVDGRKALQADADASSSFLVWERDFDPSQTPVLEWEWKVSGTVPNADLREKDREDSPARMVVMFSYDPDEEGLLERVAFETMRQVHGEYPPAKVLTYVWGNRTPRDTWIVSTYSERIRINTVESGDEKTGQWQREVRNIAEDYRERFGGPLPKRARIGIVVDTDDTGVRTTSWFDNIRLSPAPKSEVAALPAEPVKPAVARSGG